MDHTTNTDGSGISGIDNSMNRAVTPIGSGIAAGLCTKSILQSVLLCIFGPEI